MESQARFFTVPAEVRARAETRLADIARLAGGDGSAISPPTNATAAGGVVYRRNANVPGPVSVFGYDYLLAHYGEARTQPLRLLRHRGTHGTSPAGGGECAYEILNLVDGSRSPREIRDAVAASYGPVPQEYVVEYLEALKEVGLVNEAR